jgi:dCMP deaminase
MEKVIVIQWNIKEESGLGIDMKWDLRFLQLADHISTWSRDPSTKTGSVIVNDKRHIISVGYNGFPVGIEDKEEWYNDRETKLKYICHADRNALDNAYSSVEGCDMYITHSPCMECQKSIIQKRIKRVIFWTPTEEWRKKWGEPELLKYAGITCVSYKKEFYK